MYEIWNPRLPSRLQSTTHIYIYVTHNGVHTNTKTDEKCLQGQDKTTAKTTKRRNIYNSDCCIYFFILLFLQLNFGC